MDGEADDLRRAAEAGCRLTGLLGSSRHARVHGAETGGRPAVLKVAAGGADPIGRARFAREGRVGLGLRHPGLVETLRCGDGWILLGDLRGTSGRPAPSLHDRLLEPDRLSTAGLGDVAGALAHMHARGLVHRDVKPGNILIDPDGRAVLIDLGAVGLSAGDDLGAGEIVGSPAWMAPEQLRGAPPRPSADVWSFALVLACLLCRVPAFAGSADAVLRSRRDGGGPAAGLIRRLQDVAEPELRRLVAAGLSDDPPSRPPIEAFTRLAAAALPEP